MTDAEYIEGIAKAYDGKGIAEFEAHYRRLTEIAARLRGEAAQGEQQAVATIESVDGRSHIHLTWHTPWGELKPGDRLYTRPQPAAPAPVAGDGLFELRALADEWRHSFEGDGHDMAGVNKNTMCRFINAIDSLSAAPVALATFDRGRDTRRREQKESWAAPVAGEAVAKLAGKWRAEAYPVTGTKAARLAECAEELEAALAQDRASQAGAAGVPTIWQTPDGFTSTSYLACTERVDDIRKVTRVTPTPTVDSALSEPKKKTCWYDNPSTCRREFWVNGEVQTSISWELIGEGPTTNFIWGLPVVLASKWEPGKIVGNEEAITKEN